MIGVGAWWRPCHRALQCLSCRQEQQDQPVPCPLFCAEVSGSARWAAAPEEAPREPLVHIAEKFRLAYVSRETRVRAVLARNRQLQARRELRAVGKGERLIAEWESEL